MVIFCDNQAVCGMINKNATPCSNCMVLIRKIVLCSLRFNVRFFATYIKSAENVLADALLRQQIGKFWSHAGSNMEKVPGLVPRELWPISDIWLRN